MGGFRLIAVAHFEKFNGRLLQKLTFHFSWSHLFSLGISCIVQF